MIPADVSSLGRRIETDGIPHAAEILWTLIAIAGGIAKYLHDMSKNNRPFKWVNLIAKAFISGFSGWTSAHVAMFVNSDPNFILVMCAMGGWMGADGIEFLWNNFVRSRLK